MRALPAILGLTLLTLAAPAVGQRSAQELDRLQAERGDERARAVTLRRQAAEAEREMGALDARLSRLSGAADVENDRIAGQRARLNELGRRERLLARERADEAAVLGRLLSALQLMSRDPPPPLLIPADDAIDTVRASILIRAVTPQVQRRARSLADRQAEIGRLRREAALQSEALFTAESDRLNRRAEIESLRARRASLAASLDAQADRADRAASTLEDRIRALGGRIDDAAPEPRPAIALLPGGRERLAAPVGGAPVQRFSQASPGWIWRPSARAEVAAPAPATVAFSGSLTGWGEVVILDLGPGWRLVLAGMEVRTVAEGQRVTEGQSVGEMPRGEGGDLYLELRREDRPVNPAPFLD
ncbi:murein hydrolase activator EnvC [Brevundimonas sp.]|uniref:murein hydrolase activator EnvC family protein n=1 Tax=Brevundimonas sp. TaxID=1871086 RepID=UPI0035B24023